MFSQPYMRGIVAFVGVAAIIGLLAYTYLAVTQARYMYTGPVNISVSGEGEVFAKPDIATFSFSVYAEGDDATTAQNSSAEAINAITAYLGDQGIEDRDIKTVNYYLSPRYEYLETICNRNGYCPPGERVLRGYEVNQTIQVKVRDTEKAGELISGVGTLGATDISGLQFTIDDETALMSQAREKAIQDAEEKARQLAADLGVRIVRMTGFYENSGPMPYAYGKGGVMMETAQDSANAPSVPTGENSIISNVTITYEIR